jgi:hypothetical protein
MNRPNNNWMEKRLLLVLMALMLFNILVLPSYDSFAYAAPQGPTITFNNTQTVTPQPATAITTAGGSFTTIILNATQQTPRWKAYVGNVTGRLVLDDATSRSIFDWSLASVTGEVYASRNGSIDWATIACANRTTILNEDDVLNMSQNNPDTINRTFSNKIHRSFYVGSELIQNSTCQAIATYVNDSAQTPNENANFQEILLQDDVGRMVYSTLINQNVTGFNTQKYDFQLIVAENEYQSSPTTYYMYVELT